MAASPRAEALMVSPSAQDKWAATENGGPPADIDRRDHAPPPPTTGDSVPADLDDRYRSEPAATTSEQAVLREKQVKVIRCPAYVLLLSQHTMSVMQQTFGFFRRLASRALLLCACCFLPHMVKIAQQSIYW